MRATRFYKFSKGDKVRIVCKSSSASLGVHEHQNEIVTIKSRCPFTLAYELKEYPSQLWTEKCFERV